VTTHDTDPCPAPPPTRPDHARPEPSPTEILNRVETLATGLAEGVAAMHRIEEALQPLLPVIPNLELLVHEVRRHGRAIAEAQEYLAALPCRGGRNGGAPPECPVAAE